MAAMKTRSGIELTGQLIERLAERAEVGFDLAPRASRGGRPSLGRGASPRVQFRVDAATFEALLARARAEDRGVSEVARDALKYYLREGQGSAGYGADAAVGQAASNPPDQQEDPSGAALGAGGAPIVGEAAGEHETVDVGDQAGVVRTTPGDPERLGR